MKRGQLLLGIVGILLSAAAVFVLLRQVSAHELARNLRRANVAWLIAGCATTLLSYWLRAVRWGEILLPEARVPPGRLFSATMVGFLAINTLPARLGELVRAYTLARMERLRTTTVLGSVVIERIFDLVALAGFWALSLLFAPYPAWFRWSGYLTIGLSLIATGVLWLLHSAHYHPGSRAARFLQLIPARLFAPLERPVASFTAGLRVFGRPNSLLSAGATTVAMWLVSGSVFLMTAKSLGLNLPLWSPFLLAFIVCVAIMVPSSPGFIGVLEGSCVVGLALLGVDASRALAYGVLYHITQVVPVVLVGGAYAIFGHIGMRLEPAVEGQIEEGRRKE